MWVKIKVQHLGVRYTPGMPTEAARPACSRSAAGRDIDGGSDEPSCTALAPRRAAGSCEDCGDSGGVPSRRGVSVHDEVVNRVLSTGPRVDVSTFDDDARGALHTCAAHISVCDDVVHPVLRTGRKWPSA